MCTQAEFHNADLNDTLIFISTRPGLVMLNALSPTSVKWSLGVSCSFARQEMGGFFNLLRLPQQTINYSDISYWRNTWPIKFEKEQQNHFITAVFSYVTVNCMFYLFLFYRT